jgi:hypothetical protein
MYLPVLQECARCGTSVSWHLQQGRFIHVAPQDHDAVVPEATVPPGSFVETLAANVYNSKLDDAEFRAFVRRTLTIVRGREV